MRKATIYCAGSNEQIEKFGYELYGTVDAKDVAREIAYLRSLGKYTKVVRA